MALKFDKSFSQSAITTLPDAGTSSLSFGAIIKLNNTLADNNFVFSRGSTSTYTWQYYFNLTATQAEFGASFNNGANFYVANGNVTWVTNQWYYCCGCINYAAGNVKLWIDGSLLDETDFPAGSSDNPGTDSCLGRAPAGIFFYDGAISQLWIQPGVTLNNQDARAFSKGFIPPRIKNPRKNGVYFPLDKTLREMYQHVTLTNDRGTIIDQPRFIP